MKKKIRCSVCGRAITGDQLIKIEDKEGNKLEDICGRCWVRGFKWAIEKAAEGRDGGQVK